MNASFWQGKRVLLTGHTGFKGSWLTLLLQNLGAEVFGFSLAPSGARSLFADADLQSLLGKRHCIGDIRNIEDMRRCVKATRPDVVFHLAAQALVAESYNKPLETYQTNVMGTANCLDALRAEEQLTAIVVVTSDKCYDNKEWHYPYRESDPLGGFDPYSSSKACTEILAHAYRQSYFQGRANLATARAGNVIGGGDWAADRLVPDLVRSLMAGTQVGIRNQHANRPWQHVLEPLAGYVLLAEQLASEHGGDIEGAWNFGPGDGDARTVGQMADILCAKWGEGASWGQIGNPVSHEATNLTLDSSKARNSIGWAPKLGLDLTLDWIVSWHKQYQQGSSALDLTRQQISQYLGGEI